MKNVTRNGLRLLVTGLLVCAGMMMNVAAQAETIEIKMLNRGEVGPMVFEPAYVEIQPGDSIKFIAVDKGHNAESIDGFAPAGFAGFKGEIDEEIEVTLDQPGFYGIKCFPHFSMGMVALIKVGDVELTDDIRKQRLPGVSKKRFADLFDQASK
ncbi:pseudoazurin [Thalassospira sp. MA62]|nr:pseudoazurin [Thalassospira sp. MA62]